MLLLCLSPCRIFLTKSSPRPNIEITCNFIDHLGHVLLHHGGLCANQAHGSFFVVQGDGMQSGKRSLFWPLHDRLSRCVSTGEDGFVVLVI